jgi:sugar lactone lactonase YvrE
MTKTHQPELLCDGFVFPESPRWHRGSFYCTSIDEGTVFKIDEVGNRTVHLKIDDWLSGWVFVGPDTDEIILTSALQRKLLRWDGTEPYEVADLSGIATYAVNDLIRSADGTTFVGAVNFAFGKVDPADMPMSPLIRIDSEGNATVASDLTAFPNGLVITPDGKRLIVADSMLFCLHQWDLAAGGTLSNHRTFATIPGAVMDGISLDANGGVWVTAGHRGVFRVLEGGEITDYVDMGTTGATACMLGGADGQTLLITASDSHDRDVISKNPSGRLFTVRVEVPGAGLPSWY